MNIANLPELLSRRQTWAVAESFGRSVLPNQIERGRILVGILPKAIALPDWSHTGWQS
jgi:hypothetical protein